MLSTSRYCSQPCCLHPAAQRRANARTHHGTHVAICRNIGTELRPGVAASLIAIRVGPAELLDVEAPLIAGATGSLRKLDPIQDAPLAVG